MAHPFDRSTTITSAGVRTFVASTGDGPPLLLLHGNPDTHDVWGGVVERLRSDFTCHAPDTPGFGASDPQRDLRLEQQAEWVRELIATLGLERPHLVCHDVGANYGSAFLCLHPELVSGVTFFNCAFASDFEWHFWGKVWRLPLLGELAMLIGNRALFVNDLMRASPNMSRDYANRAYDHFGKKTRDQVLRFYRYMDPARWKGWETRLAGALEKVPHQVIWGEKDPYIPVRFADRLGGELHRLPDCGHWAMVEAPDRVAPLIRALAQRGR